MMSANRTALICDLAETYGIYDYRSLPLRTVATLSAGLRSDSRIMMKLREEKATRNDLLLATIADGVNALLWRFGLYDSKPPSIFDALIGISQDTGDTVMGFDTPEEFEAAMKKFER